MTASLEEILLAPGTKPHVVADCLTLIKQEVADLSGISGTGIKLAYKAAASLAPDYLHYTVESKLPRLAAQLEPFWADFYASGGAEFGDYLAKRGDKVADALLAVTDASAASPTAGPVVVKAYKAVRSHAAKHVIAALPRVGALVQTYA
jgi:hypothetical protein